MLTLSLAALVLGPASCVPREPIEPTLTMQYQEHLVRTGPQTRLEDDPYRAVEGTTGPKLEVLTDAETGRRYFPLSLHEAVYRTLANDPEIQVVAYAPAISYQDIIEAQAAFDWVIGSQLVYERVDAPNRASFTDIHTRELPFELTATKRLTTGGQLELSYTADRREENTPIGVLSPSYQNDLRVQLTQPLLRGAGAEVNLAAIRVARLNYDVSLEDFRAGVLDELLETQTLYWQLVRARQELQIAQNLVQLTEQLYERILARGPLDASRVQIAQAQAAIETRRAILIRARRAIGDIEDQLRARMSDASLPLTEDIELIPTTPVSTQRVIIDTADQLSVALKNSPELSRARTAIQINEINVRVARNQELPVLNLIAGGGSTGFDDNFADSFSGAAEFDYINYNLGFAFEWPVGNRAAIANRKRALFGLDRSIAAMQGTADQVSLAVRESIRQVDAAYEEIQADEAALRASIENRDALDARTQILGQLTPEALNLQLDAQARVATAEQTVLQATVDYNVALDSLARANGTALRQLGVLIKDDTEGYVRRLSERVRTAADDQPAAPPPAEPPVPMPWVPEQPSLAPAPPLESE